MDMTREALEYILEQGAPQILTVNGSSYTDRRLQRIPETVRTETLKMSTLTSFVDYVKTDVDCYGGGRMLIHVAGPSEVCLLTPLNEDGKRDIIATADADIPSFDYGQYIGHERFLIAMQSKFLPGRDRDLLLKFAGTVKSGTIAEIGDDGVTQKATVKSGIASVTDAVVPNPVLLRPYRTFLEVDQPESSFVFRMRETDRDGVQCAIFEADGGAWRHEAMENTAKWLKTELEDFKGNYIVIY